MQYHLVSWVWYWREGATTALPAALLSWHPHPLLWHGEQNRRWCTPRGDAHWHHAPGGALTTPHSFAQVWIGSWLPAVPRRRKKGIKTLLACHCPPLLQLTYKRGPKKHSPAILVSYPVAGILVLSHGNQCCWNTAFKKPHITRSPNV